MATKNISSLLQRGNLTPRERYILLIQNDIAETQDAQKKGIATEWRKLGQKTKAKGFLSEADKEALVNWQAKTSEEAREWNKYNEGWKLCGRAGIEAEMLFMQTLAENNRKNIVATELAIYPFYREHLNALQALKKIKVVDINEAVAITNKQREQKLKNGFSFDYAVYRLAFESLSDYDKNGFTSLYEEVETETSYLNEQEIIYNLFNGKDELTKEAKEKLAEFVAEKGHNKLILEANPYFACIPIMEIAKKWAKEKGIKPSTKDYEWLEKIKGRLNKKGLTREKLDKDKTEQGLTGNFADEEWLLEEKIKELIEQYAKDNQTTPKEIIKATCLKWLDEDLFKQYTPLVLFSKEFFDIWLKAKKKARETLKTLADKGELEITADKTGQDKTITGESLYSFKGDFKFVKEFKERVDRYDANAGLIYADDDKEQKGDNLDRELLIAERDKDGKVNVFSIFGRAIDTIESHFETTRYFKETTKDGETYLEFQSEDIKEAFTSAIASIKDGYAKLLAFQEIFKKLNKIYEAETDVLLKKRLGQVSEFIDQHNRYVENALEDLAGFGLYKKPLKTRENLYIEKDKIAPDAETKKEWTQRFSEVFNDF